MALYCDAQKEASSEKQFRSIVVKAPNLDLVVALNQQLKVPVTTSGLKVLSLIHRFSLYMPELKFEDL